MTIKKIFGNFKFFNLQSRYLVPVLFFLTCVIFSTTQKLYKTHFRWDAAGYYSYLPAFFIYDDLSFKFTAKASGHDRSEFVQKGSGINTYSIGPAILQTPFFGLGFLLSKVKNQKVDGYNSKFKWCLALGAIFYCSLGLLFLSFLLREHFTAAVTNITLIGLGLGTNLFYYVMVDYLYSHGYSFFLFSLSLWLGVKWGRTQSRKYLIALSLIFGLIVSVRVTNALFLMVPIFWMCKSGNDYISKIKELFSHWKYFPVLILLFLLPLVPQLLYLHEHLGYVGNPYVNEPFFWSDPLMLKVLFSYRVGWILWSPLILLGFIGWVLARKKEGFSIVFIYTLVNLYLISSWWCWWYGGGFGMRALVEASVPMSFGIAYCIQKVRSLGFKFSYLIVFLLIFLNIFQSEQYRDGVIHYDAMTFKSYWTVFGKRAPLSPEIREKRDSELHKTDAKKTKTDRQYRREL